MPRPALKTASPYQSARANRFPYWFARISRALSRHVAAYAGRELGLNLAEFRILLILCEVRSASVKDIAADAALDKAQVTRTVAALVDRGLAVQAIETRDRRLRIVKASAAGRKLLQPMDEFMKKRQLRLESKLASDEVKTLWSVLPRLLAEAEQMCIEEMLIARRTRR